MNKERRTFLVVNVLAMNIAGYSTGSWIQNAFHLRWINTPTQHSLAFFPFLDLLLVTRLPVDVDALVLVLLFVFVLLLLFFVPTRDLELVLVLPRLILPRPRPRDLLRLRVVWRLLTDATVRALNSDSLEGSLDGSSVENMISGISFRKKCIA